MIHTIRVTSRSELDPPGEDLRAEVRRTLGLPDLRRIRTVRVYRLEGVDAGEARHLAEGLLVEALDQAWSLDAALVADADRVVEVAYRPGVMNPETASILKGAQDLGVPLLAADSSREYAFYGSVSDHDLQSILDRLLVNPTIQRVVTAPPATLRIVGEPGRTAMVPIHAMDDAGLTTLSDAGLHLTLDELYVIRGHFASLERDPTDLELEVLAQTWSEHCAHKTFKSELLVDGAAQASLMQRLKQASALYPDLVVSAFVDNSGVMRFYEGWAVAGKVETHNSPSAIEPYGGAMTGSGGVFRDVLGTGQGAAVIASTDIFCFAPPDLPVAEVPPGALPPDYLLRRVVAGVRDYGNRMGIPTNNGSVHFHPDFRAKPTVIVGAYGLLPEPLAHKGTPRPGDRILVLGGRTGRDGIHGATFSSTSMTSQTISVNATAVQIGNAVEERRLLDAVLACRDASLIRAITDCGAGGFSSAIGEMAEPLGAAVRLERAPLKYTGLAPWEIFLSESQERMVMAVAPEDLPRAIEICRTYNVEASDLGSFEATGRLVVSHGDELVGNLDLGFLHDGRPNRRLIATLGSARTVETSGAEALPEPPVETGGLQTLPEPPVDPAGWLNLVRAVLAHPNVASKEPIVRQYDHNVQGMSALPPYGGPTSASAGDAAILVPLYGRPYGLVIAHGLNPILNRLDPYWGSVWAAAEAVSNLAAVGGDYRQACLIDNFIWPTPTPRTLGDLDRAVDACVDVMHALQRPFISGKDSLSSTYRFPDGRQLEIPPVLCVSVFGRIPDVAHTVSSDFKAAGSTLLLVGARDLDGMGGALVLDVASNRLSDSSPHSLRPPHVDLQQLPAVLDAVHLAIVSGRVLACHDVSEGGLMVALAEMAFGSGLGAAAELGGLAERPDVALFNETAGVFVVEVVDAEAADELFESVPHVVLGKTIPEPELRLTLDGRPLFTARLDDLRLAWEAPLRRVFH